MTDTQREAFEAWASSEDMSTATGNCGWYIADGTAKAWRAWVAAQAADAGREAIYQIQMIDDAWGDVTEEQYEHLDVESKRIVYTMPPVAAINAELVEALEALIRWAPGPLTYCSEEPVRVVEKARAALSRAKEQKS